MPVVAPVFHTYPVPPDAVSVTRLPEQIVEEDALTNAVGVGLTTIPEVAVFVQPFAPVTVTV